MTAINIATVNVLNNPASFRDPLQFEISYECLYSLQHGTLRRQLGLSMPSSCFGLSPAHSAVHAVQVHKPTYSLVPAQKLHLLSSILQEPCHRSRVSLPAVVQTWSGR